jgi:hypothetical protein
MADKDALEGMVLDALKDFGEGEAVSSGELRERFMSAHPDLSSTTLDRSCIRLQRAGWVERVLVDGEPAPDDVAARFRLTNHFWQAFGA